MKLFKCGKVTRTDLGLLEPQVVTPLGNIEFKAKVDGFETDQAVPPMLRPVGPNADGFSWSSKECDLELILCEVSKADGATGLPLWAGIWRLRSYEPVTHALFLCEWSGKHYWNNTAPDSGQYLYAKEWDNQSTTVWIGTEDGSGLAERASVGDLPSYLIQYFANSFHDLPVHYEYMESGLPVPILSVRAGDLIQIQFVVTWTVNRSDAIGVLDNLNKVTGDLLTFSGCS